MELFVRRGLSDASPSPVATHKHSGGGDLSLREGEEEVKLKSHRY